VDLAYAYRFGAIQQDTVVATLTAADDLLSQAFFYPGRARRVTRPTAEELGLAAEARATDGGVELVVSSARVVHGLRALADGLEPDDDGFDVEPGRPRRVVLRGRGAPPVRVSALNLAAPLVVEVA